jgi:type VI secretion system secreted protein Hcp
MADIFILEIASIKGNCSIEGYIGQMVLHSFGHSVSIPMQPDRSNTERTSGRPNFSELSFSKASDIATPALYNACVSGAKLGDAKIHIGRTEGAKWMSLIEYVLSDAMVSNISTSGGGGQPSDSFSIDFTKITQVYSQQSQDSTKKGAAGFGWDLVKNIAATPA